MKGATMKLPLLERIRRALRLLRLHGYKVKPPVHPKAHVPNKPSPPVKPTAPSTKPGQVQGTLLRKRVHRVMCATVGNPYHWTYWAVRPSKLPKSRLTENAWKTLATLQAALRKLTSGAKWDCSFGVKSVFYLAGVEDDPTGEGWGAWGNSSTTYDHLPKAPGLDNALRPSAPDLARCKVGWIVLVGQDGAEHMAAIMESGPDPLLWSFGHEGAPDSYLLSADARRPISVCIPKGLE
jgi:hypothetical protein